MLRVCCSPRAAGTLAGATVDRLLPRVWLRPFARVPLHMLWVGEWRRLAVQVLAANGHSAPFLPVMGQGAEVAMPERSEAKARHFVTAEGLGMITHRCGARRGWIYSRRTSFSCVLWCVGAVFVHACCVICRRKNKHGNLREGGGSSGARSRRRVRGLWSVTRFGTGDILGIRVACYNTFTLALYHSRILPVSPTHRDDLIR